MKQGKLITVLLYLQLAFQPAIISQYKLDKPIKLNTELGLPSNDVRSITKDENGFMWMGTADGLCRFDGMVVKTFKEGPDPRYSIYDNSINSILVVKNKIWIATRQGISVLNTNDYTFKHYQLGLNGKIDTLKKRYDQSVNCLMKDKFGAIWLGTAERGVALYDDSKDNFNFYRIPAGKYPPLVPALGSPQSILSLRASDDNDSLIYAGTTAGLQIINKYKRDVELVTFPQENKNYQVGLNVFRKMYFHTDGLLYTGGWAAGANVYDPATKKIWPLEVRSETAKKYSQSVISGFFKHGDHQIWISTGMGAMLYDIRLKDGIFYKPNNPDALEFYTMNYIDDAGRIWCSDMGGVNIFDPLMHQFPSYEYQKKGAFSYYVISDKTGNKITVCPRFTDCIYIFDKPTKQWTKKLFPHHENFIKETDVVNGFVELSPGEYVISSDKGVYRYSLNKNSISRVTNGFPFGVSRKADMLKDKAGNVWISDNTWGLTRWNPATEKFINYKNETQPDRTDSTIISNRVMNLYEDSKANIWFQMPGGFGVYVAAEEKIAVFNYVKNEKNSFPKANGFAEDNNGKVWIASADGWVGYGSSSDPRKGVIYKMNIRDKGIAREVLKLAADPNGQLWGATENELIRLNTSNNNFETYDFKYGPMEMEIDNFSFLPSGEIVIGGRNNIFVINPNELKRNSELPDPYVSEMQVLNQPFAITPNDSLLKLNYKQNFFSIGFSAKAYSMAKDVKFRYRLFGFDDWSEETDRRFANYTNVPGGDYVFQLQAANNEGIWNEKILELPIHVATAFWATWWFRVSLVVALALAGYWLYRYRVDQVKKKQQFKSDYEKKLANVEMSALLAQMNPHFLFNSLNSIDSYIIRNESKQASEYLNNFARLMRLILQNSRSNYISLKDELEALELYMQMESLRFKNKFSYSIAVDENVDTNSIVIPPMLIQPYVENAIWHGLMHRSNGIEGLVKIGISKKEDDLQCVIEDNGIGRAKAAEIKAQKPTNHKRSMGMQITQDRIEIINKLYNMNASVHVHDLTDAEGNAKGTKVELNIPV